MAVVRIDAALPGSELVRRGLDDLSEDVLSAEAMVVAAAAPRLRDAGLEVPEIEVQSPLHRLYAILAADDADTAHSRYNALVRRVAKFASAIELRARTG